MRSESSMLCRTAGQLGIVTSAAATVASYSTLLRASGELLYLPPSLLVSDLLNLALVPVSLFVAWTGCHPRRRQLTLTGCAVLATLVLAGLAVLQCWTGLYSLWGATFLLSAATFDLGSISLLAASYHDNSGGSWGGQRGGNSGSESGRLDCRPRRVSWLWEITLPLVGLSTLCAWTGRLASIPLATVVAACVLYAVQLRPTIPSAPWVPVAAMLLALEALHYGLYLALVAVGPLPVISPYEALTTGACALAALGLAAFWFARAHRTRSATSTEPVPPALSVISARAASTPGHLAAQRSEGGQTP
jgi:hypothetical protein